MPFECYYQDSDGDFRVHNPLTKVETLKAGRYDFCFKGMNDTPTFKPVTVNLDSWVDLPNDASISSQEIANKFLEGGFKDSLASMGLINKMSMMLWGVPGTSKSMTLEKIVDNAIKKDWVVINGGRRDPDSLIEILNAFREIEPERGIVVIWEEVDGLIRSYESELLTLLDGGKQYDNILYLMTTNYIHKIPSRIWNRQRRINYQVEFNLPTQEEREVYFKEKMTPEQLSSINLEEWLEKTNGFSLDQCAQALVQVFAWDSSLAELLNDIECRHKAHE